MRRLLYAGAAVALAAAGAASAPLAADLANGTEVLICHLEPGPIGGGLKVEMLVPEESVAGHLLHGDTRGACFVETVTVTGPAETVTLPGTTTTLPGETTTITLPGTTTTLPGDTTTITLPGTVTTLAGETTTITLPGTTTTLAGETTTITLPGDTTTVTLPGSTTTVTQPGDTRTVTLPGDTTTVTVPGPATTVTLPGSTTTLPGNTATVTVPGAPAPPTTGGPATATGAGGTVTQSGVTTTVAAPATSGADPSSPLPAGCPQFVVSPRTIPLGRPSTIVARVRRSGVGVRGEWLVVRGAGLATTAQTRAGGVARVPVRPSRGGIVEIHIVGQPTRCARRIGVVGIFQPPKLTG